MPSARTSAGNISVLIRPLVEVWKLTIASAGIASPKAAYRLATVFNIVREHCAPSVASTPKQNIEVLQPILSNTGETRIGHSVLSE